jgi:hypothetical protein
MVVIEAEYGRQLRDGGGLGGEIVVDEHGGLRRCEISENEIGNQGFEDSLGMALDFDIPVLLGDIGIDMPLNQKPFGQQFTTVRGPEDIPFLVGVRHIVYRHP